ncbi:hypothetical protein PTI98_011591 [Pleurotus ostreatus]|nr:hypothetical protein PTI98_011591 [Pleurotus ostreatus]
MSVEATPRTLWERSLMGCACHIGELSCDSCEAYLYHVSTGWGANEKGLRDIVKTNNNAPLLQAQLSEMETKFSSLQPSIARIADLEDQIRRLTDERDIATRLVSHLEAKISMTEKESPTESGHLDQIRLLTTERDRVVKSLNEQTELLRVQTSVSEASDARCSSLAAANGLLIQEKHNRDTEISQLRNEIDVLVLKNKEILNAHNKVLQDERSLTADLRETIRFVEYSPLLDTIRESNPFRHLQKVGQLEVKSTTDGHHGIDKDVRIEESGGQSNLDNATDCNDDRYEERTVGALDASHHNNTHSRDHHHDLDDTDSGGNPRKRPRYSSAELRDTHGKEPALGDFNMHATPPPSPLPMGPIIDYPMRSFSPAPTPDPRLPKINPIARPQIDPLNSEWRIPPSWVPANAHVSVVDGKWRAGSDKEDALRNEALHLPPPALEPPFGTGFPQNIDQVKQYMELASQPNQERALAYVLSWVKATEKIHPSQYFSWMSYLRQNWRQPQWIKDKHPDTVRSRRPGSGHVKRRRQNNKVVPVSRPRWDAPLEDWGHYFWSSPKTVRFTDGLRLPNNNNGIKLRQVRGYVMVASRAPFEATERQIWHRACAELLAFPRRYEDYVLNGLSISNGRIMQPAKGDEEIYRRPYGFFWLLDNRFHAEMGQGIKELVKAINEIPKHDIDAVPRFEPQVYPEPSKVLISDYNPTEASSSRRSMSQPSDDGGDDYDFY